MHYYEVAVEDRGIKQLDTLTYQSVEPIPIGSVVRIEIRTKKANGVVMLACKKPRYPTKDIMQVLYPAAISPAHIKTMQWLRGYYATELGQVVSLFLPRGAHKKRRAGITATPHREKVALPMLSMKQKDALKTLIANPYSTSVLHGITGSGKTRIYIERAKQVVAENRGVVFLVPEIGLTSQMVQEVEKQFSEVFVIHSNMGEAERHQQWQSIYESKNPVVIGPRSVLFSPIQNLGLIIIDEEHETSYKQDLSPKYHAVHAAAQLRSASKSQLILGSATPRIEDYYLAEKRKRPIITIDSRINPGHNVDIKVIDLKKRELLNKGSAILSGPLIDAIEQSLANDKQVLLFHNRRGSSTSVLCTDCGWVGLCPHCHAPLTHHADWQQLVCHICNHRQSIAVQCPDCKSAELHYKGFGTKQIQKEIEKLFPQASIARFDSDVSREDRLENRYSELHKGGVQVIIGTQVVAKGLDLPNLETVGVVLADTALYMPDYSANERAFQLLYQVLGRVGRHQSGTVIVQTYTPEHAAIDAAIKHDYTRFYQQEIKERELLSYPPFAFLLQLSVTYANQSAAIKEAEKMASIIQKDFSEVLVLGPSPAFYEQTKKGFRWQIVVKSKQREKLLAIVDALPPRWQFDLDPINLL